MKYMSKIGYYHRIDITNNVLAINIFHERRLEIELNTRPGQMLTTMTPMFKTL